MDGHKLSDKIETDCLGVILKKKRRKIGPTFFKRQIARIKVACTQNDHVCDVTIVLSVKEFHITIFEF